MADQAEVISLASETRTVPKSGASNYVAISEAAELVGGGSVYLARNRKAMLKWQPGEAKPPVYVTSEVGTAQQSVPYRAVGTALQHDVVPLAQVLNLYRDNDRLADVMAWLAAEVAEDLAMFVAENEAIVGLLADLTAPADGAEVAEAEAEAEVSAEAAEVSAEDLALAEAEAAESE
jgi:hypothetical protein